MFNSYLSLPDQRVCSARVNPLVQEVSFCTLALGPFRNSTAGDPQTFEFEVI